MSLDWVIETFDEVPSTQDCVREQAIQGAAEGYCVQAINQTGGRGRHGRVWESQEGNLFLSLLLRPECPARDIGQLSLITGVAVLEAIQTVARKQINEGLTLKWPNDVLLHGDKCAGLLLETELDQSGTVEWAVLGIGVNVAHAPKDYGVSLDLDVSPEAFRDAFLGIVARHYQDWLENGFDALRIRWLGYAHIKGQALQVKVGERLENGTFHDIDAFGNLRLKDMEQNIKTISSGEVYLY